MVKEEIERRNIPDAPGYSVSPDGRVFTTRVSSRHRKGGLRELCQSKMPSGYRYVRLWVAGEERSFLVHRLVAAVYLPAPLADQTAVRHLDGNPSNNDFSNLAWGTQADNMADCMRHGRTLRGVKNPNAKLNERLVVAARILVEEGFSHASVAKCLGVSEQTVGRAVSGDQWGCVDERP